LAFLVGRGLTWKQTPPAPIPSKSDSSQYSPGGRLSMRMVPSAPVTPESSLFSSPGNRVTCVLTFARGMSPRETLTTKSERISAPSLGEQLISEQAVDCVGTLNNSPSAQTIKKSFNYLPYPASITSKPSVSFRQVLQRKLKADHTAQSQQGPSPEKSAYRKLAHHPQPQTFGCSGRGFQLDKPVSGV
jgi:hypothetical protein